MSNVVEFANIWGDKDTWKLICQYGDRNTKAMQVDGVGVLVQVTTPEGVALAWVPFAQIIDVRDADGKLTGRRIDMLTPDMFALEQALAPQE